LIKWSAFISFEYLALAARWISGSDLDFYFNFRVPLTDISSHLERHKSLPCAEKTTVPFILALSLLHDECGRCNAIQKLVTIKRFFFFEKDQQNLSLPLTRPRHARTPPPSCAPPCPALPASPDTQPCHRTSLTSPRTHSN
jgi:hypothetical protein